MQTYPAGITVTDDGIVNLPDRHVLYRVRFHQADPLPFGWHVFVLDNLDTLQALREAHESPDAKTTAYAWALLFNGPDAEDTIASLYFVQGHVYVGMVAHEALHLASWMCRYPKDGWPIDGRQQSRARRMTLGHEPEELAEHTGELTSTIWYNLEADGMVTVDTPTDSAQPA